MVFTTCSLSFLLESCATLNLNLPPPHWYAPLFCASLPTASPRMRCLLLSCSSVHTVMTCAANCAAIFVAVLAIGKTQLNSVWSSTCVGSLCFAERRPSCARCGVRMQCPTATSRSLVGSGTLKSPSKRGSKFKKWSDTDGRHSERASLDPNTASLSDTCIA